MENEAELHISVKVFGNGIYAIDQQMVRAFLLVGTKGALLLDTCCQPIDLPSYVKAITNFTPEVLLTHGDGDHIGNLNQYASAYVHENDMAAVLSHSACAKVTLKPLAEGDVFDIGGRVLRVLHTPGHTAGSVCFLDEANQILFSGDTLSYGPVFMFGERRSMEGYRESLLRLRQMCEEGLFRTVYCCHNLCPFPVEEFDDLISCVDGILNHTIKAKPAQMPISTDNPPMLGKVGNCGILFYPDH